MLHLQRITKRRGGVAVLTDVTLHVARGECVGLIAPRADGRNALMRIAATIAAPDSGSIAIGGIDARRDLYRARLLVAFAGAPAYAPPGLTVLDYMRSAIAGRVSTHESGRPLDQAVSRAGLERSAEVAGLTPCARQRLAIAAALYTDARLLVLDNPWPSLDDAWTAPVLEWIGRARDAGTAVFAAADDPAAIDPVCTRFVTLTAGRITDESQTETAHRQGTSTAIEVAGR